MTAFAAAGHARQIFLLILSLFTVANLICCLVVSLRRPCRRWTRLLLAVLLGVNTALYVAMQLAAAGQGGLPALPWGAAALAAAGSLGWGVWATLADTRNRKTVSHSSIKESFDTLPVGVCFFNEAGLPILCNLAMHRLCSALCGRDVQYITDMEACLEARELPAGARREGDVFILPDGSAWMLDAGTLTDENGERYTQFVALNVTDLYRTSQELGRDNEELRRAQRNLQRLSANVVAATREEEILAMKMRVHDEMGKCLAAAQKYLEDRDGAAIPDSVIASWQRAVNMLKFNNRDTEEDMLAQIRKTCALVNMAFVTSGSLPAEEETAYLLTCAVRECVTNAVRYAKATELRAAFSETEREASVSVTNNGLPPEDEIREGGGLSTLRRRVELAGGTMAVQSRPEFMLTVTLPKGKEDML